MIQFLSSNISNCRRYSHELHYASFCYIVALTFWIHLCKQKDQLLTQRLRFFFQNSNLQKWKKNEYQRMPMFKMRLNFQKWKGNEYQCPEWIAPNQAIFMMVLFLLHFTLRQRSLLYCDVWWNLACLQQSTICEHFSSPRIFFSKTKVYTIRAKSPSFAKNEKYANISSYSQKWQ